MLTINSKGKTTTEKRLYIRSAPNRSSRSINVVEVGIQLAFDGYTDDGESIDGNSKWYFTHEGNWFWSGGCIVNETVDATISELKVINYNRLFANIPDEIRNSKGRDVVVTVMDTGILQTHPNLLNTFRTDFPSQNCSSEVLEIDRNGHGTHIAGLIAARESNIGNQLLGIAPECYLQNIKVLNDDLSSFGTNLSRGINAIQTKPDIVNMSLSLTVAEFRKMESLLNDFAKTCIVVCAAGENNRLLTEPDILFCPAFSSNVISVGSINQDFLKNNSNPVFHPRLDFILPDMSFFSCSNQSNSLYRNLNGSSMATGLVSGLVALIISTYKTSDTIDTAFIRSKLNSFATPFSNSMELNTLCLIKPVL